MNTIPVALPVLGKDKAEAAGRVILSGWVTQGPEVAAFEAEFAQYVGATYAKAVSNCTAALHMALLAVGISARRGVMCAHREQPRAGSWACQDRACTCAEGACPRLAVSEQTQDRGLILPLYPQMTQAEQDRVVQALHDVLGG